MSDRKVLFNFVCKLLLILLVVSLANAQVAYVSVRSGAWTSRTTWAPRGVPGPMDTAIVSAGNTVGLAAPGVRSPRVTVGGLLVVGTLTPHFPVVRRGSTMTVTATTLINVGTIRGENGGRTRGGGSVFLSAPRIVGWIPSPGFFWNSGTIQAGTGSQFGGNVSVFYPNGRAVNTGRIRGGTGKRGGFVRMWGTIAVNANRDMNRGLWGGRGRRRNGSGGNASLVASNIPVGGNASATNARDSLVRGGRGTRRIPGPGGSAMVRALGVPPSPALNDTRAMIRGGDGCPPGPASLFGTPTINRGTIRAGNNICIPPPPPPRPVRVEPPEGLIEGWAKISGDIIELSAGNLLRIGDLNDANEAISAVNDLVITLAPGGVLDLVNNPSDVTLFSAGKNIIIHADEINLPDGVSELSEIADAYSIVQQEGEQYSLLDISPPDANFGVEPNETIVLSVIVSNLGNMSDEVSYNVSDTASPNWVVSIAGSNDINAMGADILQLQIQVPLNASEGDENIITIDANTDDANAISEIVLTVIEEVNSLADNPIPEDDAGDVSTEGIILSWTPGEVGPSAVYDVYFGTDDTAMDHLGSVSVNTIDVPEVLDVNEYYLWRVDVTDGAETYKGNLWGFETYSIPYCEPSMPGDLNGDCKIDFYDFAPIADDWLECNLVPDSDCP